jgi:hypothetical protein
MSTTLGVFLGAAAGLVAGYMAGVFAACEILWPESNLCGLVAVFGTAPAGLLAGAFLGGWVGRRFKR